MEDLVLGGRDVEGLAHDVGKSRDDHLDAGAQPSGGQSKDERLQVHADTKTVDVVKVAGGMHTASGRLRRRAFRGGSHGNGSSGFLRRVAIRVCALHIGCLWRGRDPRQTRIICRVVIDPVVTSCVVISRVVVGRRNNGGSASYCCLCSEVIGVKLLEQLSLGVMHLVEDKFESAANQLGVGGVVSPPDCV